MLNVCPSSLVPMFSLAFSVMLGGSLHAQASEKLKPCQMREGTWLECRDEASVPNLIQSSYALKKAEKAAHSESPLVLLAGGPGQPATEAFLPMNPLFDDLNRDYDLIFFDPRGTNSSAPLTCSLPSSKNLSAILDRKTQLDAAKACIQDLSHRYVLSAFGTDPSVLDLEQLRIRLGYKKLSLYGISYGTRLALRYAALYPDHVDRIILEGVLPPEALIGQNTFFVESVVRSIANRCLESEDCRKRYPDPYADYRKVQSDFNGGKAVDIRHPLSGVVQKISLDSQSIDRMLLALLYSEFDQTLLPAILNKTAAGELAPLVAASFGSLRSAEYEGLYYATACAEDVPYFPAKGLSASAEQLKDICSVYRFKPASPALHQPIRGAWPVLLLSGELDPVTSPSLLQQLKKDLTGAIPIIVPNKGHNVFYVQCVAKNIRDFLLRKEAKGFIPKVCGNHAMPFILSE